MNAYNRSIELSEGLAILRDVFQGYEDPESLRGLVMFDKANEFYKSFGIVYQQMTTSEANPSPLITGNALDSKGNPVTFGSWHEYGYFILRGFQMAYQVIPGLEGIASIPEESAATENEVSIRSIMLQIDRELLFAESRDFSISDRDQSSANPFTNRQLAILECCDGRTLKNVEIMAELSIDSEFEVSEGTIKNDVRKLIDLGELHRPEGTRKGVTRTTKLS